MSLSCTRSPLFSAVDADIRFPDFSSGAASCHRHICSYVGKYLILWRLNYYPLERENQIFRRAWNRVLMGQKVAEPGHFWDQPDGVPGKHLRHRQA